MTTLLLSYKRVGELFRGDLGGEVFEDLSFADMMLMASVRIVRDKVSVFSLRRTECAGLSPVTMEPNMLELLTSDPAEYIRLHSPPARRVLVKGAAAIRPARGVVPLLRAGYDTLAAAFGDMVYLRIQSGRVESPDTGRWDRVATAERRMGLPGAFEVQYVDATLMSGWALLRVDVLLTHRQPLFYIPRAWNPYPGWIQRSQLQELYDAYEKEKNRCLSEVM